MKNRLVSCYAEGIVFFRKVRSRIGTDTTAVMHSASGNAHQTSSAPRSYIRNNRQNGIGSTSRRSSASSSGENTQRKPCKMPCISTVIPINT